MIPFPLLHVPFLIRWKAPQFLKEFLGQDVAKLHFHGFWGIMGKRMISRIKVVMGLMHSALHRQHPGLQNGQSSKIILSGKQRCLAQQKETQWGSISRVQSWRAVLWCLASGGCSNNASIGGWANTTHACISIHNDWPYPPLSGWSFSLPTDCSDLRFSTGVFNPILTQNAKSINIFVFSRLKWNPKTKEA